LNLKKALLFKNSCVLAWNDQEYDKPYAITLHNLMQIYIKV